MIKVGIYGGSGYTGQELLRLLVGHPGAKVVAATSRRFAGVPVAEVYPVFSGLTDLVYTDASPEAVADLADLVFLALPHGVSMEVAPIFFKAGRKVIDLSADFRIRDAATYEAWYGRHTAAGTLREAVYGLPELHRERSARRRLVANPGCYPTSIILGLAPVLQVALDRYRLRHRRLEIGCQRGRPGSPDRLALLRSGRRDSRPTRSAGTGIPRRSNRN